MLSNPFTELFKYLKLGEGLAYVYRMPPDPNYRATVETFIKNRETNFLKMAKGILANSEHPYSQLFQIAGCTYGDLEAELSRDGLETTLNRLLAEGVYLSLDEFRCNTEIVRGGRHIRATMANWDNAAGKGPLQNFSSGSSSGKSLKTSHSLEYFKFGSAGGRILLDEFQNVKRAIITMMPILPTSNGLGSCMGGAKLGYPSERWYALGGRSIYKNAHYKAMTAAIVARLRLGGANVPYPTYLEPDDFSPVAEFIARRKKEGMSSAIMGMVSSITRVAATAIDGGFDIHGTIALVTGESLTDAKRDLIESAGIEVYPMYATSEFGGIGVPCRQMRTGNCVHIGLPSLALVSRRQKSWADEDVDSLHITNLLSFAPRMLINVEIGDTGVIEPATCDCEFSRIGYRLRVRDMAAITKLRFQGCALNAPELIRLLEEGLAQQFGGRPGDYQMLEIEGKAQTEIVLRIHPRTGVTSPEKVLKYFLDRCCETYGGAQPVFHWTQSNAIWAELKPPILAASGKFRAIRLLGAGINRPAAMPNVEEVPAIRAESESS
jgi:hypothetical protein